MSQRIVRLKFVWLEWVRDLVYWVCQVSPVAFVIWLLCALAFVGFLTEKIIGISLPGLLAEEATTIQGRQRGIFTLFAFLALTVFILVFQLRHKLAWLTTIAVGVGPIVTSLCWPKEVRESEVVI